MRLIFELNIAYADDLNHNWWEKFEDQIIENEKDIPIWAKQTVDYFNKTLRSHEHKRIYLGYRIISTENDFHQWVKTSLHMQTKKISEDNEIIYDTYECQICGITGTREIVGNIQRDYKYRAKRYKYCSGKKV